VLVTAARVRILLNVKGEGSGGGPRRRALDEIASAAMELLVRPRKEVRGTWRRKARGHHDE
jgi:hypothetical protein